MAKKKDKVPETKQPRQEPDGIIVPVEIIFHVAGSNVEKINTPQGTLTTLSLVSPTGIAVTVKMNDGNVKELVKELEGNQSDIVVTSILPPGLAK